MAGDDHEFFEAVKAEKDEGWKRVWFDVIVPETSGATNAALMKKWSVTAGDLMGRLYEEMIGRGKIDLYRDDGGSFAGWLRTYVRGFIRRSNPNAHGEFSLEATAEHDERGEQMPIPVDDKGRGFILHDVWFTTHKCFLDLWNDDPRKAYVMLCRTKLGLSAVETAEFLGISNKDAVDQIFSRAVKAMRAAWPRHDKTKAAGK